MITTITKQHSDLILQEMFDRVGAGSVEDFDFDQPQWYLKYEWTEGEQDSFTKWLGKFLRKYKYVGKGKKRGRDWGEYEASKMVLNYGWKLKGHKISDESYELHDA